MNYFILIFVVFLGAFIVFIKRPSKKNTQLLLAFSGAYLLSVTVLHLLPEVYEHATNTQYIGFYILAGILLQSILESFSKGAEHGHVHIHADTKKFPWLLLISLCIHAFSEGVPIHNHSHNLLWAIAIHKIPIVIVLTSFFIHAKYSKKNIFIFLSIFALMSPLGIFLAGKIPFFSNNQTEITAFIIGVLLHISTIILFESSENHKFHLQKFLAILAGILLMIFGL